MTSGMHCGGGGTHAIPSAPGNCWCCSRRGFKRFPSQCLSSVVEALFLYESLRKGLISKSKWNCRTTDRSLPLLNESVWYMTALYLALLSIPGVQMWQNADLLWFAYACFCSMWKGCMSSPLPGKSMVDLQLTSYGFLRFMFFLATGNS